MKKLIYLILSLTLFITSCATSVDVYYLQPSEVDMGQARNIAIASAVPYSGRTGGRDYIIFSNFDDNAWYYRSSYSDMRLKDRVAEYASRELVSTLANTGYFNILDRNATDSILSAGKVGFNATSMFREKGVDAVIIPKITGMDINEFIYRREFTTNTVDASGQPTTKKEYKYYLSQIVSLDFEYSIISTKTEQIVAIKRFSKTVYNEDVPIKYRSLYSSDFDLYNMFRTCIDSFQSSIARQLVPVGRRTNITLMQNKPKDESIQIAYEMVENGNTVGAKALFLEHYAKTGFIPSGYNSALLSAATGDFDTAIKELSEMVKKTTDSEVAALLRRVQSMKADTDRAEAQIKGESSGFTSDGRVDIYNQVLGN